MPLHTIGLRREDKNEWERRVALTPDAVARIDRCRAFIQERIGAQLQTTGLLERLTVREQIALFARLYPRARPANAQRGPDHDDADDRGGPRRPAGGL